MWFSGLGVTRVVWGGWLDWMILEVSSYLDDSMILTKTQKLQGISLQKASTDDHRADISKSH